MSEMPRWREAGAPATEIDRMLSAALPTRAMPANARARLLRRLDGPPPPSGVLAPKLFVVALAIGAVGLPVAFGLFEPHGASVHAPAGPMLSASDQLRDEQPPPGPAAVLPETPSQAPPASPRSRQGTSHAPRAARPDPPESSAATSASDPPGDTLAREVALLERARAQLDADPASTLGVLDQHARAFPHGKLAIERELLAIDALERLGKTADARSRAERALQSARGTIYESRIRSHLLASPDAPF
jgi:hypothetical protein